MKIFLGTKGLKQSWQEPFIKTIKCQHCKKTAKIMFVMQEGMDEKAGDEKYICKLHKTTGKTGGLWVHDCVAIASYLCPFCFEVTAVMNQA